VERAFVKDLDTSAEWSLEAKLPKGFLIRNARRRTGNPDWAISFKLVLCGTSTSGGGDERDDVGMAGAFGAWRRPKLTAPGKIFRRAEGPRDRDPIAAGRRSVDGLGSA